MAIANVGDGGYNSATASGTTASVTLAFPAGIVAGNLVIAAVNAQQNHNGTDVPTVATPTGWTLLGQILGVNYGTGNNQLYLFGAIYSGGLTGIFNASTVTSGGIEGNIRGLSGTGASVGTAFGNFTSVAPTALTTTAIPGPSGFTAGQWNYWCAIDYFNGTVTGTSPALSNVYYNAGAFNAFEIGTTAPGSAPGTETITWSSSAGNYPGVGVTVLPASGAATPTSQLVNWFERQRRFVQYLGFSSTWVTPSGTIVPTVLPPEKFWDPARKWIAPPGFDPTWTHPPPPTLTPASFVTDEWWTRARGYQTQSFVTFELAAAAGFGDPFSDGFSNGFGNNLGFNLPPAEPFWEYSKQWRNWRTPGFEAPPWRNLGVPVRTEMPSENFWDYPKKWRDWRTPGFEQPPWRNLSATIPTAAPPPPWFDPPQRWIPKQWFEPTWFRNIGIQVPTTKPSEPWFDPPKRWVAPPGFEAPPWRNLGIPVPQALLPEPFWVNPSRRYPIPGWTTDVFAPVSVTFSQAEWWSPYKLPKRIDQVWDGPLGTTAPTVALQNEWWAPARRATQASTWWSDVLRPLVAQVISVPLVQSDFWSAARRAYSTISWDGNYVIPLAVVTPVPSEWWALARASYRAQVFEPPPWRNLGTTVPTTKPSEPWFDPPQRWSPKQWFEVTWFQNLGTTVPTAKPSEPWFDPPKRWNAPPGFEPTWVRPPGVPVPASIPPPPWFDPPQRWVPRQWFEVTWFRNLGIPVPTTKPSEPWFDPPKRWVAPPGFEPTWARPFGTQVPTSVPPPEWWVGIRRWPAVSTWSPDVFRPLVAAVVTPSFVSAEWFAQARRQASVPVWDSSTPLVPSATPSFIGADWWGPGSRGKPRAEWADVLRPVAAPVVQPPFTSSEWWVVAGGRGKLREWWDFIPPGSRFVPFMDQAWWGLTARTGRRDDWRHYSPTAPLVGVLGGWQAGFFDAKGPTRRSAQDWALGPFFAFTGTPSFVQPLQIVNTPTQTFIVKGKPVSDVVEAIDIVTIVKK